MSFCNIGAGRSQHLPLRPLWVSDEVKKVLQMLGCSQNLWLLLTLWLVIHLIFSSGDYLFLVLSLLIPDLKFNLLLALSISFNTFHSLEIRLVKTSLIHPTPPVWVDIYHCTTNQIFFCKESYISLGSS